MLGKRKRSERDESSDSVTVSSALLATSKSSAATSINLPLTVENLAALETQTTMGPNVGTPLKATGKTPAAPRTPRTPRKLSTVGSTASTEKSRQANDAAEVLASIRIRIIDADQAMPPEIRTRTEWMTDNPRDNDMSPTSKDVLALLKTHNKANERMLMLKLSKWLTEVAEGENSAAGIIPSTECQWQTSCVPFLEGTCEEDWKTLMEFYRTSTPRPDVSYGYKVTYDEKEILHVPAVKALLQICSDHWFSFLSVEWKSTWSGGTIAAAQVQCARNGAAAVRAMHNLYVKAGIAPSPEDTMHISMAIDQLAVFFHVHWRWEDEKGRVWWEMDCFDSYTLIPRESNIQQMRATLHNIFKWARETRIPAIKKLIPMLDVKVITGEAEEEAAVKAAAEEAAVSEVQTQEVPPSAATPSIACEGSAQTDEGIGLSASSEVIAVTRATQSLGKSPAAKRKRYKY